MEFLLFGEFSLLSINNLNYLSLPSGDEGESEMQMECLVSMLKVKLDAHLNGFVRNSNLP